MPSKSKGAAKATKSAEPTLSSEPQTVFQRAQRSYEQTNPYAEIIDKAGGLHALSTVERTAYINQELASNTTGAVERLGKKAQKELWKQINESSTPLRKLPKPSAEDLGKDKYGRNIGDYKDQEYRDWVVKSYTLFSLLGQSQDFKKERYLARKGLKDTRTGEKFVPPNQESVESERDRRREMAALRQDLYGVRDSEKSPYSMDPSWDDVIPIPQTEPEGALASIAYPSDYADATSYLRAVMALKEYSPRCLGLTEHIISMNPAHYTVWLYRFAIIQHLQLPIPDELAWLSEVALDHQKNYQIWHHRQLLLDHHYPSMADTPDEVARFAKRERDFMMEMFSYDAKNYHVWTYRQYAVRKLSMWDDPEELASIEGMVDEDVRNNSAWSHRFFLVFSNPSYTTPDSHATAHDPAIPAAIIDREVDYAKKKVDLAPQNQSPWNYLRGVLAKGGRELASVREFSEQFVTDLGEEEEKEKVRSSHALDLLADIYQEMGQKEKADLCLRRLGEKWDRIRKGYWEYRRKQL